MSAVTVAVPVYNGRDFVGETLHALLNQSFRDLTVLVIDDGSTDGSSRVVEGFHDPRLRLVRQPNLGLSESLNRALSDAKSEFFARSDQDDVSLPQRLERQIDFLRRNPSVGCVFSHYSKFGRKRHWSNRDKQTTIVGTARRFEPEHDGCQLASTLCGRTSILRRVGFRQAYYPADDWDFELRLSAVADVRIIAEPLVKYRFHASANTYSLFAAMETRTRWAEDSFRRRRRGDAELTLEAFLAKSSESWIERRARKRLEKSRLHTRLAGQCYLDGRDGAAILHALAAGFLNPSDLWRRLRRLSGAESSTSDRILSKRSGFRVRA
jgi:glycosyltransferase involved in cell wall biosynthesis